MAADVAQTPRHAQQKRPARRLAGLVRWPAVVLASLALHAGLGLALRHGVDAHAWAHAAERTTQELPVRLGIDRSQASTPAWLGFVEPSPHAAPASSVEQSALTRRPGLADEPAALAGQVQASIMQGLEQAQRTAQALGRTLAELLEHAQQRGSTDAQTPGEPAESASASPPRQAHRQAQPADPTPQPAEPASAESAGQGTPGLADVREADASSLSMETSRQQLGRVLAGPGLRINTTRLRLTDLQRAMGRPPSPLVEIFFDHRGRVVRARIVPGQGTGRQDLDQALLNAIYEWTAQGERVQAMSATDRPLLVRLRILF